VFWSRSRREARRQQVLDELLGLEPEKRSARLEVAVAAGDVRADEVESALRLVHRLDQLRVMTVPPSARFPGGIVPVIDIQVPVQAAADPERTVVRRRRKPVPIVDDAGRGRSPVNPPVVSVDVVEAATERISADLAAARKARLGARSSRQRRLRVAASRAPAHEAAVAVVESSRDEAWPSIEWLRP
jgi:hypothetical protein